MKKVFILSFYILLFCASCSTSKTIEGAISAGEYEKVMETDNFIYYSDHQDMQAIQDIDEALEANCPQILLNLECEFDERITVELYHDQNSYDESLDDKSVTGSPACSGNKTIKLVSPKYPIKISGISYEERIDMAIHEYVHLLMDEINDTAPVWLDEGIACYEGSKELYDQFSRLAFPHLSEINLTELEDMYYKIQAADVYSYSAVKFIIEVYGYEKFNRLLRKPSDMAEILMVDKDEFSAEWNSYIQENYRDSDK